MQDCIFCKIIKGEIPCKKVYEDDDVLAFHDINPSAPIHFLLIPKKHLVSLAEAQPEDTPLLGKMLALVPQLAKEQGCHVDKDVAFTKGREEILALAQVRAQDTDRGGIVFRMRGFSAQQCNLRPSAQQHGHNPASHKAGTACDKNALVAHNIVIHNKSLR